MYLISRSGQTAVITTKSARHYTMMIYRHLLFATNILLTLLGSMEANGNYYTSMMSEGTHPVDFEDFSNPCNEQQSQEVLVTPSASSARPNHKRSKNFSEKEDEILVSAWLNVSLDPITGANQTHKSYWTRIHDYFHENLPFPSDRTQNSLMHRWSTIQDSVNKFTRCLSRIAGRRQSGATVQDKVLTSYV
jgi:hypothetical protein